MIKVGTLFSGIGAPEFALRRMGIDHEVLYACDFDSKAKANYLANHKPHIFYDNIFDIDPNAVPEVDVLIAGFPCQPYSSGGLQKGEKDVRAQPMVPMLNIIGQSLPKVVVLENVSRFLLAKKFESVRSYLFSVMESYGYEIESQVLNSKNFGLPQNRERAFIICYQRGILRKKLEIPTSNGSSDKVLKDILVDNPIYNNTLVLPKDSYFYDQTQISASRPNYDQYRTLKGGIESVSRRVYKVTGMGPCVAHTCMPFIRVGEDIRQFHTDELFLMQGFDPKLFINKVPTKTAIRHQLGNTMSLPVIQVVLEAVLFSFF